MSEQPPQSPPPPPPAPGPAGGGAPVPGVPRPGELLDRFLARLIDGILLGILFGIVFSILTAIIVTGIRSTAELFVLSLIYSVVSVAVYIGYYAFFESTNGRTLGKQLLKLQVVGPDGASKPTMEQAVRRNIWYAVGLIGIIPFAGGFLGSLVSLAIAIYIAVTINNDPVNRQGWHDKFAGGTRVLKVG